MGKVNITPDAHTGIDTNLIPDIDRRNLCSTFLSAIQRFYEDPENRKRFERWMQERQPLTTLRTN